MKIKQHYTQCKNCGRSNSISDTEEVRTCVECKMKISLTPEVKRYLIKEQKRLEEV